MLLTRQGALPSHPFTFLVIGISRGGVSYCRLGSSEDALSRSWRGSPKSLQVLNTIDSVGR